MTDRQKTESAYTISFPGAFSSGELKKAGIFLIILSDFCGKEDLPMSSCSGL